MHSRPSGSISPALLLTPPAFTTSSLVSAPTSPLSAPFTSLLSILLLLVTTLIAHGERGGGKTMRQVHLRADRVGKVGDEKDVLDVVVAVRSSVST